MWGDAMREPTATQSDRNPRLVLSAALGVVTLLLVIPACFVVVYSFWLRTAAGAVEPAFDLSNWQLIFGDPFYRAILFNTFKIAAISTVICALAGYIPAYFVARTRSR